MHTHSMLDWQACPHGALWHSQCVSMKTEKMRGFSWRIELLLPLTHSHKHTHSHTALQSADDTAPIRFAFRRAASLYIWRGSSTQRSICCKTGQTNAGDKVWISAEVIRRKLSLMCEPNITRWRAAPEPSSIFMQILRKANPFSSEPLVFVTHQRKG